MHAPPALAERADKGLRLRVDAVKMPRKESVAVYIHYSEGSARGNATERRVVGCIQ